MQERASEICKLVDWPRSDDVYSTDMSDSLDTVFRGPVKQIHEIEES